MRYLMPADIGVVEPVHAQPFHIVVFFILFLHAAEHGFGVNAFFLEDHIPRRSRILRIYVEFAAFHGRLYV